MRKQGKDFYKNKTVVINYDASRFSGKGGVFIKEKELESLLNGVSFVGKLVVDMGAGTGRATEVISKKGAKKIIAVDNSRAMLKLLSDKLNNKKIIAKLADVTDTGIDKNTMDIVVSLRVFEHLNTVNKKKFLVEVSRILKKGGLFTFSTLNKKSLERTLLSLRKSKSPMYPDEDSIKKYFTKYGFKILKKRYNFILPRVLFRDAPNLILKPLIAVEISLQKTFLKRYSAHVNWIIEFKG